MARLCDSADNEKTAPSPHPPMIYDGTNALEEEEDAGQSVSAAVDVDGGQVLKTVAISVSVIVLL